MKDIQNKLKSVGNFLRPFEELFNIRDALLASLGEQDQIDSLEGDIKAKTEERDALKAELAPILADLEASRDDIVDARLEAASIRQATELEAKSAREAAEAEVEKIREKAEKELTLEKQRAQFEVNSIRTSNVEGRKQAQLLSQEIEDGQRLLTSVIAKVDEAKAKYKELTDLLERI